MTITKERHRERSLSELPVKYREIAAGGADPANYGYEDRFAARRALLAAAILRGWTFPECSRVFLSDQTLPTWDLWGSGKAELGRPGRQKRLLDDFRAVEAFLAANPVAAQGNVIEIRQQIGEIRALAETADWHGVAGRTDHDVLFVLYGYGTDSGSLTVLAPCRTVAIAAGVGYRTVARSLARLDNAGWLQRQPDSKWLTGRYTITQPESFKVSHHDTDCTVIPRYSLCHNGSLCDSGHETWVDLGKTAHAVWLALSAEPCSARSVGRMANVSQRTTLRALRRLQEVGMATYTGKRWIAGQATPDDVAKRFELDRVAKRARQYEIERAAVDREAQEADIRAGRPIGKRSYSAKLRTEHPVLKSVYAPVAVPPKGINWKDEFELTGPWADAAA